MGTTAPNGSRGVIVDVSEEGVRLKREEPGLFGGSGREFSWSDVSQLVIETSEDHIESSNESDNYLPIRITSAELRIERSRDADSNKEDDLSKEFWQKLEQETGIIRGSEGVEVPKGRGTNKIFSSFIQFMFERNFLEIYDLPIQTTQARKNYVVALKPENIAGEPMNDPHEIDVEDGPVYIDQAYPSGQRARHIELIVSKFVENGGDV